MTVTILRRREVCKAVGLSYTSIFHMMREGRFPRPLAIGAKSRGWRSDEVQDWIDRRTEERDAATC